MHTYHPEGPRQVEQSRSSGPTGAALALTSYSPPRSPFALLEGLQLIRRPSSEKSKESLLPRPTIERAIRAPSHEMRRLVCASGVLFGLTALAFGTLRVTYGTRPAYVHVRWAETVADVTRQRLERQYSLSGGELREGRTWGYALRDRSRANVRGLVTDPAVEDTHHIHRTAYRVDYFAPRLPYPTARTQIPLVLEVVSAVLVVLGLAPLSLAALTLWAPTAVRGPLRSLRDAFISLKTPRRAAADTARISSSLEARAYDAPLALARDSVIVGSAVYGLSYLLSYHDLRPGFGEIYASMSERPFQSGSPFEYRYLIPVLGWLTGLRGDAYHALSIVGGALFCVLIYAWSCRFYRSRSTALLLTLCLAFLSPIEFNHVAPSRPDVFGYVWLLGAMLQPAHASVFVFLGLSTHEFFLMYLPWLYVYLFCFAYDASYGTSRQRSRTIVGLAVACLAYALARWIIASLNDSSVRFSAEYYWAIIRDEGPLAEWRIQPIVLGLLVSLKTFWIVLPFAVGHALRIGKSILAALLVMPAIGALALLLVAHDTSRLLGHAFVFVLLLPYALPRASIWLPIVFVLNASIPSFYFGADWYVPSNSYACWFDPWIQKYFYQGMKYLPIWNR
jgi:hypothetical protein